jgi:hypothetical protein
MAAPPGERAEGSRAGTPGLSACHASSRSLVTKGPLWEGCFGLLQKQVSSFFFFFPPLCKERRFGVSC